MFCDYFLELTHDEATIVHVKKNKNKNNAK